MIEVVTILIVTVIAFLMGALSLLGYMMKRMMGNSGWDDSNITNALRLVSHVTLHPEDFGKMFYLTEVPASSVGATAAQVGGSEVIFLRRPFHYVGKDELSGVVRSRPPTTQ